jgi:RecA-family ATPase
MTAQPLPPVDWDRLQPMIDRIPIAADLRLPEPSDAFRNLPYLSAREVARSTSEHPEWIVPGFAARQAITELGGRIKSAGKTTFTTHLVAAALDGLPFLGQPTEQTNVIYLTEQTRGSFREALRRACLLDRGDELRIIFRRDVTKLNWRDLVAQVATDAKGDGYGLVVVDTLGKFAGIRDENDAAGAAEAMVPLNDAAHDGLAVWACRHERKGGGEVGEAARGSSAFGGDADIILSLRRPEGNQRHTLRELHSLSRYDETPDRVLIDLTEEGYSLLGDVESVAIAEAMRIVSIH